ncbi:MAG: hypothetical protein IJB06_04805 [Bacteroidales bacterium]|nr:hypothetical protein [Bacteroidales bacterium]
MKKTILILTALMMTAVSAFSEDKEKKDWGYLTGSLESTNHVYVKDAGNNFDPAFQPQLKDGNIFATNDYLKLDYYKGRLSAGLQMEGYFPTLVGYPVAQNKLSLSNLYVSWRDKSYSVTAGTFYEQFGSGLLFRSWEDRMLGLNNALLGARATYNFEDKVAVKAFWGVPRLGKIDDNAAMLGAEDAFFGLGLTKVHVAGADVSVSLSSLLGMEDLSLSLEGSLLNKHEALGDLLKAAGCKENTLGWSGRVNFDMDGFFLKGEYVDAGKQIVSVAAAQNGRAAVNGNAQLVEFGYNGRGLGVTVTGRRMDRMTQKIYSFSGTESGYGSLSNMLSYRPAMSTQYTYMLTTLNPYSPEVGDKVIRAGEIGGQIDAFYNFRRGTAIGGKRGMKVHANFSTYYGLNETGGTEGGGLLFRDFSFDIEKQWTKKFKSVLMYSMQEYNKHHENTGLYIGTSHIVVADLLYKWTPKLSTRMELQYLATKDDQGDWMAGLLEVNFAPHWSVFASDMWNHGSTKLHYYNAGLSFSMAHLRVAAGYGRYRAGFICSGGVCRAIPAYTGANISLTASF